MVDRQYNPDRYKSFKISIGSIIKIPEMLRFVSDHPKTKKVCKQVVKKCQFIIRHVSD